MALASARWRVWGLQAEVFVEDSDRLPAARRIVETDLDRIDRACSRFRADSELCAINRRAGNWVPVSPLCRQAIEVALRAARISGGLVDPTIGRSLRVCGYDRDFDALAGRAPAKVRFVAAAGWRVVEVDPDRGAVRIPRGVELDLGVTAKALAADRTAAAVARELGRGAMVGLGGDVAMAGPPPPGAWPVRVTTERATDFSAPGQTVALAAGGLATSSTVSRRWSGPSGELHHILDPRTGRPGPEHWRAVSVAAGSCLDANIASTAAILQAAPAARWLAEQALPARLTAADGQVVMVAGWPRETTT